MSVRPAVKLVHARPHIIFPAFPTTYTFPNPESTTPPAYTRTGSRSMASLKQIEANRRNSKKSTGPRTPEGKAVSRMNALTTGIDAESQVIRGEDSQTLDALTLEYHQHHQPATPEERSLVDALVRAEWLQRRLARAEAELWEYEMQTTYQVRDDVAVGQIFAARSNIFIRLQRRIDAAERSFRLALRELERVQKERKTAETKAPAPEIGFVPDSLPNLENLSLPVPTPQTPSPLPPPRLPEFPLPHSSPEDSPERA